MAAKKTPPTSPSSSSWTLGGLLVFGVIFHIIYSWSIFDIYFRTPLVHGMEPELPPQPPLADRLVLFVADGLRADKLYENDLERAPYLKSVVSTVGSWGVSHTRVPTESRPGHVALIAGFYEDVSAVTQGWKHNPVNFDSLFNESFHTWSFGSPDILPMFSDGASDPSRVSTSMYPPEFEDFAEEDASKLDTWVFERFYEMLDESAKNETLWKELHSKKVVFFLHLLGLDTNGHGHRPYSPEYLENIMLVDREIGKLVARLESFFDNDSKTAYVFTSDHGMSNRGNHGDGHPDNTETPLVAWGAGIRGPDEGTSKLPQQDSTLIGVPFPMNSVGELPNSYLNCSEKFKAEATFGNAKQILKQFLVKQEKKRRTELFLAPFEDLLQHDIITSDISKLIAAGNYGMAEAKSQQLAKLCVDGLRYYQTYDWLFLRSIISTGYCGWIAYSLSYVLEFYGRKDPLVSLESEEKRIFLAGVAFWILSCVILGIKKSPPNYYFYVSFAVYLWTKALQRRKFFISSLTSTGFSIWSVFKIMAYLVSLELLVFSYFYREILTPCLLILGFGWPLIAGSQFSQKRWSTVLLWRLSCAVLSVFTLLPVEHDEDMRLVTAGGIVILISGGIALYYLPRLSQSLPKTQKVDSQAGTMNTSNIIVQLVIIVISMFLVNDTSSRLANKQGLPLINQAISWLILASCVGIPMLDVVKGGQHYLRRLVVIYLSFAPLFILLSLSYETIFYFCFALTLFAWLLMERHTFEDLKAHTVLSDDYKDIMAKSASNTKAAPSETSGRPLSFDDLRTATIFLFLVNVAFFGTGNIASDYRAAIL
ncbi:Glycosyl phosphatidyl inositol anchor synthesis [Blyttiomyces sp. JEL0837]|nr:Glycosyl phosphatidyl inositol anchor synthesis [Blyttiomyces sp. JEL0837]